MLVGHLVWRFWAFVMGSCVFFGGFCLSLGKVFWYIWCGYEYVLV